MDISEFANLLQSRQSELADLMRRRMPVIAGRMAKDYFQDNFRLGGFVNGGLHKWAEAKRLSAGGASAASHYGTLLSGRNHLFSSINYYPGDYQVRIENNVHYAPVHNWGGETHPAVTDRMRRFAWAKFYEAAGIEKKDGSAKKKRQNRNTASRTLNPQARFWKQLALTRKSHLTVKIPQRQFLGESQELNDAITSRLESEISKILNL